MQPVLKKTLKGYMVKHSCRCGATLLNKISEVDMTDHCPSCNTSFVVPGRQLVLDLKKRKEEERERKRQGKSQPATPSAADRFTSPEGIPVAVPNPNIANQSSVSGKPAMPPPAPAPPAATDSQPVYSSDQPQLVSPSFTAPPYSPPKPAMGESAIGESAIGREVNEPALRKLADTTARHIERSASVALILAFVAQALAVIVPCVLLIIAASSEEGLELTTVGFLTLNVLFFSLVVWAVYYFIRVQLGMIAAIVLIERNSRR